jgi:hypothetical protein
MALNVALLFLACAVSFVDPRVQSRENQDCLDRATLWTEMTSREFSVYEPVWVFLFVANNSDDTLIVRRPDASWDSTLVELRYYQGDRVPGSDLHPIGGPPSNAIPPHDTAVFPICLSNSVECERDKEGLLTMPEGKFQCELRYCGRPVKGIQIFSVKGAPKSEAQLLQEFYRFANSSGLLTDSMSKAIGALYEENRESDLAPLLCSLAFTWVFEGDPAKIKYALDLANRFPNSGFAESSYDYLAQHLTPKDYSLLPALATSTQSTSVGRLLCKQALRDARHR